MTITTLTARAQYNGNGATTEFAIPFEFLTTADVLVIHTDSSGVDTTWALDTQYGVTNADGTPITTRTQPATGKVVVDTSPTDYTPATGETLTILRNQALTQSASYTPGDSFPAKAHEKALDRLSMQIQQEAEKLGRAPKFKSTSTSSGITFPEPEAGKIVGWNADGDGLENKIIAELGTIEILDEDDMASDSATKPPSQQSVKAFVEGKIIDEDNMASDSATKVPTQQSVKAYADTKMAPATGVFAQSQTGEFASGDGARIHKMADRVFIDKGAAFGGQWGVPASLTGLSDDAKAFHVWAPRDASVWVDSSIGAMPIVGHAESANNVNYPGLPATPAGIGVAGFTILNSTDGQGWGLYGDTVKLPGSGFGVAIETTIANFDDMTVLTPYNYLTGGSSGGPNQWIASGGGLDLVQANLVTGGYSCWDVNHAAAGTVYLSSFTTGSPSAWAGSTSYSVGDHAIDGSTDVVYRCVTAHTSGSAFTTDRAANPTYWKARPGFYKGVVFTAGSLAEQGAGTNVFSAVEMTERSQITWHRKNASDVDELSAFIWATNIPDGSDAIGITFQQDIVNFTADNGIRTDEVRVGVGSTDYARFYRATGANGALVISNSGTGAIAFTPNNGASVFFVSTSGASLTSGMQLFVNSQNVVGSRKTGWAAATGTATRTTFATGSVTLPQLAERVKALIDDLTTHGLIGT